jgi:hypothetical protein
LAYCISGHDADKIFSEGSLTALTAINCVPTMPLFLKSKRTVIVKKLDSYIYDNSQDEIKVELNANNDGVSVVDVFKFPNSNIIKVICNNQESADICLRMGVKMFHLFVSPRDIHREEYFEVKTCYKCYSLDSHLAHQCTEEAGYVICSKCAVVGHNFRSCTSGIKCCINCNMTSHSTLSFSCPKRKEIIKRMKEAKTVKSVSATVVNGNLSSGSVDWATAQESIVLSVMCLVVASAKEKENPGSLDDVLSALQTTNNVPRFKLGDVTLPNFLSTVGVNSAVENNKETGFEVRDAAHQVDPIDEVHNDVAASDDLLSYGEPGVSGPRTFLMEASTLSHLQV